MSEEKENLVEIKIPENFIGGHINGINPDKSMEEAVKDAAQTEMSAEEQQAILKEIIQHSKRSIMGGFKKPGKMISPNAAKNKKAKSKMQKKSRKVNRKKKK